jgi:hypothetical protein
MPWARFDDQFHDDPDLDTICDSAGLLHLCGTTWSSRNLTDGNIPKARVAKLSGGGNPQAIIDLLTVGWWVDNGDHYTIRSFLKYNPSRSEILAEREATASRVQKWRNGKRYSAECNGVTNTVTGDVTTHVTNAPCTPAPGPVPVPSSESDSNARRTQETRARKNPDYGMGFSPDWEPELREVFEGDYFKLNPYELKAAWNRKKMSVENITAMLGVIRQPKYTYLKDLSENDKVSIPEPGRFVEEEIWRKSTPFPAVIIAQRDKNGHSPPPSSHMKDKSVRLPEGVKPPLLRYETETDEHWQTRKAAALNGTT